MALNTLEFTALIGLGALVAGFLGALTGLGGGVVIVPLLTVVFHVDIHYAIGAALVLYLRVSIISIIFGVVLLYSAYASLTEHADSKATAEPDRIATWLRMDSSYPGANGMESYHVRGVPQGFALMFVAGVLSGLLGIGSGAVKVLAMDKAMKLPFKVSTTTSNFMIGVTAAAGAGVYLRRGYIDPGLAMPVMLGVLAGSLIGARVLAGAKVKVLRLVFGSVIGVLALEMIYNGLK